MKKQSGSMRNLGTYTSPGTPENHVGGVGMQKGWQSERVPLHTNSSRNRPVSVAALSGRALPSKWDDAERWITSPVSGYSGFNPSVVQQPQTHAKSKSGPLGSSGVVCFSNYSPSVPVLEGKSLGNFLVGSPFTTGVLVSDSISIGHDGGISVQSNTAQAEDNVARTSSVPGWSEFLSEASSPSSRDEKLDCSKDGDTLVARVVSQRDMATQMSPNSSIHSSPKGKSLFSTSPPLTLPAVKPHRNHSSTVEVRDVQVDKGATAICQSERNGKRMSKKLSPEVRDLTSSWDIAEAPNNRTLQREEAKITAWENLQKAKAEAAIEKLEMKLEKKRSASVDKILNKLRAAEMKAQDMRSSISESHSNHVRRTTLRVGSFRRYVKMGGLIRSCFARRSF